jgi:hypothetical protein
MKQVVSNAETNFSGSLEEIFFQIPQAVKFYKVHFPVTINASIIG